MAISNTERLIRLHDNLSPAGRDAWLHLGAGVLRQAALDAKAGSWGAARWLRSDDCALLCDVLGFDFEAVRRVSRSWARPGKFVIKLVM